MLVTLAFLVFATYLLILFLLTFIVRSQRLMPRFLSAILMTAGMTLLLIDSEVFTRSPAPESRRLGAGH